MKFNRKLYGMKRRTSGGQAILEYIIIIALVAVAALTVLGLFGGRIRELISGTTAQIGGEATVQKDDNTRGVLMGLDGSGEVDEGASNINF